MDFLTSKRFLTTALLLLVVLNVTLIGMLWHQSTHRPEHRPDNHQFSFAGQLALSESQTASFSKLRQEHFLKVRPEMQAIAVLKKQLIDESLKEKPDVQKIEQLAATIGSHQALIERELALHFHELSKVCKPEQRDLLKEMLNRIATRKFSGRKARWENPPPPPREDGWSAPVAR